ncbi:MAG: serine hydrolase [Candidatus Hydrogenedentes bacterium]|nr:serine hydrolase [Candidatus Hydrogenedentota bacterium]
MRNGVSRTNLILVAILTGSVLQPAFSDGLDVISLEKLPGFLGEESRIENFRNVDTLFPHLTIPRAETPFTFKRDEQGLSGVEYTFDGETSTLESFLDKTTTTGLIVLKMDTIVSEQYFLGHSAEQRHLSMSVAKSFLSALVGIAIGEGKIESVQDSVTKYLPELAASGYNDIPIEHLLQMSSGIDFSEEYDDQESDINTLFLQMADGLSVTEYIANLENAEPSGKRFHYASVDTQVLGMILEKVYDQPVHEIMHEKIWSKIGMEHDAYYATDNHGNALVFGFLSATLRDYAKFGLLYLGKGRWQGEQVVPRAWVEHSVVPGAPHLTAENLYATKSDYGYQYKWWIPEGNQGEFTGRGVWGQYLYVNPAERVIIVKHSVDPDFSTRASETLAAFRAICAHLRGDGPIPMLMEKHH